MIETRSPYKKTIEEAGMKEIQELLSERDLIVFTKNRGAGFPVPP